MPKAYPRRPCLHCDQPHTLRGDFCSGRCRVAAWRGSRQQDDYDDDDDLDDQDLDDQDDAKRCQYIGCNRRMDGRSPQARYCCNACRQADWRERRQ